NHAKHQCARSRSLAFGRGANPIVGLSWRSDPGRATTGDSGAPVSRALAAACRRAVMTIDLAPSTRLAIRAAFVATAAVSVARLTCLERPYWIILTAVLLVYETAGESIKRSGQRLAMTFLGCLC